MSARDPATSTRPQRPSLGAFSLIETIAAVVMMAIAIPPMLWSIRDAHQRRVDPVLVSRARWLASERLEGIIADRSSPSRGYDYLIPTNYPAETPVTGYPNFTRSVSFNETAGDLVSPGVGYLTATVRLSWTDGGGKSRELEIATVLTEMP